MVEVQSATGRTINGTVCGSFLHDEGTGCSQFPLASIVVLNEVESSGYPPDMALTRLLVNREVRRCLFRFLNKNYRDAVI